MSSGQALITDIFKSELLNDLDGPMLVSLAIQAWLTNNLLDDLLYSFQENNITYIQTEQFLHLYIRGQRLKVPLINFMTGERYGQA